MSPWASCVVVSKKHTPEGAPQQFCLCKDYRKLNSLLPAVTLARGKRKVLSYICPCPKLITIYTIEVSEVLHSAGSPKWVLLHTNGIRNSFPKVHLKWYLEKNEFLRLPFGLFQGSDFFNCIIYNLIGLNKVSIQGQGSGYSAYIYDILIYSRTEKT